ncbi:heterokaryon incompatibility protein-domain-containing protein [Podospora didyma]|uniref:Heterokaryon incompatibility protein-domain-containing protein n=1 Tax=Podospora didyma TaxID=330526 RepID=A0AAE0U110_9PEZI|nr:heterokaryon incompatibility protein-domain-containing protein [Podospora didyma]
MARHLMVDMVIKGSWEGLMWDTNNKAPVGRGPIPLNEGEIPDREANLELSASYVYSSLPSTAEKSFRLLHLLPGTRQDDIKCRIIISDLDQKAQKYEALSYVWGAVSEATPIQVDAGTLYVEENLRSALLNLRFLDVPRILWVDAICINQESIDEKTEQIAIMGDIYRRALRTVIWLGPAEQQTPLAFEMVKRLGDAAIEMDKNPNIKPDKTLQKLKVESEAVDSIILDHTWWTRVWTAQEIVLSQHALVVCGQYQIDWDFFCIAISYGIRLDIWETLLLGSHVESMTGIVNFTALQAIKELPNHSNPAEKLLSYLTHTRRRDAGNPRDKIYGVLGLVGGDIKDVGIVPDYRSSVSDVYRSATKSVIQVSENLDILGLTICFSFKDAPRLPDLPSWVADWSGKTNLAWPITIDSKGNQRITHASRRLATEPKWEDGDRSLVIQGHVVDTITKLSLVQHGYDDSVWDLDDDGEVEVDDPNRPAMEDLKSAAKELREAGRLLGLAYDNLTSGVNHLAVYIQWEKFANALKPTNPDPKSSTPSSILCQTLCTGILAPEGQIETEKLFRTWQASLSPIRKLTALKIDRAPRLFRPLGFIGYIASTWKSYGEFPKYMLHVTERRLGGSKKGYLCLLPKDTMLGDQLVILKGGRVPAVLRQRNDGSMEFIGEAYVHGIMNGEAFKEAECQRITIK